MQEIQALLNAIAQEGKEACAAVLDEAKASAEAITARAAATAAEESLSRRTAAEAEAEELVRQGQIADRLATRTHLLKVKREQVDGVFQAALLALQALSAEAQLAFLSRTLQQLAIPSARVILDKNSPIVAQTKALAIVKELALTVEVGADMGGGFIVATPVLEHNFSFPVLIEAQKEESESEVALRLFGNN